GLWEVSTGRELRKLPSDVACLAFSHSGRTLASVDQQNTLCLWDWRTGKEERRIPTKQWRVNDVAFAQDDRTVFTWDTQHMSAWDAVSGRLLREFQYPNVGSTYLDGLALSPDGKFLARSIWGQPVRLYETATGRAVQQFRAGDVRVQAFS